jgi:hypothetical protein
VAVLKAHGGVKGVGAGKTDIILTPRDNKNNKELYSIGPSQSYNEEQNKCTLRIEFLKR